MNRSKFKFFIVGNGLDLDLGLKTKYSDFIEYLNKEHNNIKFSKWCLKSRTFPIKGNDIELEKFLSDNIWIDFFIGQKLINDKLQIDWFNFENELANILQEKQKFNEVNKFWNIYIYSKIWKYRKIWRRSTLRRSIDVEKQRIRENLWNISPSSPFLIKKIINDWQKFNDLFLNYLKTRVVCCAPKISINRKRNPFKNYYVFNFNFTNSLSIPSDKIYYLNGDLNNGILGSDEISEDNVFYPLRKDYRQFKIRNKENYFNTILRALIDKRQLVAWESIEIIIIGHSISFTDKEIYEKIIFMDEKCLFKWRIYYYSDDDHDAKMINLKRINPVYFNTINNKNRLMTIKINNKNYLGEF